jgi:hypothetical protein
MLPPRAGSRRRAGACSTAPCGAHGHLAADNARRLPQGLLDNCHNIDNSAPARISDRRGADLKSLRGRPPTADPRPLCRAGPTDLRVHGRKFDVPVLGPAGRGEPHCRSTHRPAGAGSVTTSQGLDTGQRRALADVGAGRWARPPRPRSGVDVCRRSSTSATSVDAAAASLFFQFLCAPSERASRIVPSNKPCGRPGEGALATMSPP